MPKGVGKVSLPAFIGHCGGHVSLSVVSEPLYTHLLTGGRWWGPRNLHFKLPRGIPTHGEF